jgi:putative glutamine amidotransferase
MAIIGILASILTVEDGLHSGGERFFSNDDYIKAVVSAGGTPVILPPLAETDKIERQLAAVDGLLAPGGGDLDPCYYGEEPLPALGTVYPERDEYELYIIKLACQLGKPILGICRGAQVINVAFGGSLHQDIGDGLLQHYQNTKKYGLGHTVEILKGSLLQAILGVGLIRTNSYHHQAVKVVAPGFVVCARSCDGLIEGIENREKGILAVQWHPEMLAPRQPIMQKLFDWLVEWSKVTRGL